MIPQTAPATVNAPILFIDRTDTNRTDIKGKAVALMAIARAFHRQPDRRSAIDPPHSSPG